MPLKRYAAHPGHLCQVWSEGLPKKGGRGSRKQRCRGLGHQAAFPNEVE